MRPSYGYNRYRQTEVITADPKKLIILCYEEAIRNLQVARTKYPLKEYEAKGEAVQKALDFINELRGSLDFEKGGEIARHLDAIYAFITSHILKADRTKDLKAFDQAATLLGELKSAWETLFYGQADGSRPFIPPEDFDSYSLPGSSSLAK
jgi:flagellar protein FliS